MGSLNQDHCVSDHMNFSAAFFIFLATFAVTGNALPKKQKATKKPNYNKPKKPNNMIIKPEEVEDFVTGNALPKKEKGTKKPNYKEPKKPKYEYMIINPEEVEEFNMLFTITFGPYGDVTFAVPSSHQDDILPLISDAGFLNSPETDKCLNQQTEKDCNKNSGTPIKENGKVHIHCGWHAELKFCGPFNFVMD